MKMDSILFFKVVLIAISLCPVSAHRDKRWLIFPPTAPTRVQFIYGFGIPVEDLPFEAMTTGYVLKGEYFLPDNTSELKSNDFPWPYAPARSNGKRSVKLDTKSDVASKVLNQFGETRWAVYKGIELLLQKSGLKGRPCLLMSICEAANVPFTYKNGLLGELLHVVLSPSTTMDTISDHRDNEYLRAEELGKKGEPCARMFNECSHSVLNILGGVFDPMNAIKMLFG